MDVDELVANIRHARDEALAEIDSLRRERDTVTEAGQLEQATKRAGLGNRIVAAKAVVTALTRILGETAPEPQ